MKKITFALALLTVTLMSGQKLTEKNFIATQKNILKQSLKYRDFQSAISSMQNIIALEGDASTYKDSLAITYFKVGNYLSSHLAAKEILVRKPENLGLLEINAISLQNLNAKKEAITAFEKLFAKSGSMIHGYQLATLQYEIKRLAEAKASIEKALLAKEVKDAYLRFPVAKNKSQNIPLKAAMNNLKGLIYYELKDTKTSDKAFDEALKIFPEFEIAKKNKNAITISNTKEVKKE